MRFSMITRTGTKKKEDLIITDGTILYDLTYLLMCMNDLPIGGTITIKKEKERGN